MSHLTTFLWERGFRELFGPKPKKIRILKHFSDLESLVGDPEDYHSRFDERLITRLKDLGDDEFVEEAEWIMDNRRMFYA